ncbi:MAG: T9SS type A sorting domain-containing protein [Saprospiraceae bacterium]|nr:T9SS type A sorting domain-containing protein [Candidatus Defluviibacterium haderslevense]
MKYIILLVVIQTSLNSLYSQKIQLDSAFGTNGIVNFITDYGFGYLKVNSNNEPIVLNAGAYLVNNSINYLDQNGILKNNLHNNPVIIKPPFDIFSEYPRMDIDSNNNIYFMRSLIGKDKKHYIQIIKILENSELDTLNKGIGILKESFGFSLQSFKRLKDDNYILSGQNGSNSIFVKINEQGVIDSTFHNNFVNSTQFLRTGSIAAVESDGENIYGVLHLENSISLLNIKFDGLINSNFGSNGIVNLFSFNPSMIQQYQVRNIKILHDNSIIVSFSNESIPKSTYVYKVTKNGLIDNTFGNNGSIFNYNYSSNQCLTIDKNDNIYTNISYPMGNKIVKYSKNGTIDTDFEKLNPEFYPINIDNIIYSEPYTIYSIGTYNDTITLAKFTVKPVVNSNAINEDQLVNIFPNPIHSSITLKNVNINSKIRIFDNLGRIQNVNILDKIGNNIFINVDHLINGIYFIEYTDKNYFHKVFKVIKAN